MPQKDIEIKEAIESVIGTSRLGRKKIIVKVQKKHPHMGASKIRRVYEKEGFSLYKRMKKRRIDNPANPIESYHKMVRKVTKTKGSFASENAILKQVYLAIINAHTKWDGQIFA